MILHQSRINLFTLQWDMYPEYDLSTLIGQVSKPTIKDKEICTLMFWTAFWFWKSHKKWNTRFFLAFSKRTQIWLPQLWRKWVNSFKPKVAISKFIGKIPKKVWYYKKWVRCHDDLLIVGSIIRLYLFL